MLFGTLGCFMIRKKLRSVCLILPLIGGVLGFAASSEAASPSFVYAINGTAADKYAVNTIFVDLFDASSSRIARLKRQKKQVICYFSAGSAENWRTDYNKFPSSALGRPLDGWAGERWIDYRNATVVKIMKDRIALARSKGCQGVDPDNIDGHLNRTGFSLHSRHQLDFIEKLSAAARSAGLKIGMKNSAETAWDLERLTDFAVVEECAKYKECQSYRAFQNNRKPIYQIEYRSRSTSLCSDASRRGASLIFSNLDLTTFQFCQ